MHTMMIRFERLRGRTRATMAAFALGAILAAGCAPSCLAQSSGQKTFRSADEAGRALFQAIKDKDEPAVRAILGDKELCYSGDTTEDQRDRDLFVQKYQQMHRLVREPNGTMTLTIGAENWPFPVPLVNKQGAWRFDPMTGKQEVVCRRIGENEEMAIQACQDLARAAKQKPQSQTAPMLSHGYYFRTVTSRGKRGFAVVAYPAEYRSSGVLTFVGKPNGVVVAKDLGPNTAKRASAMTAANPDSTWHAAQ